MLLKGVVQLSGPGRAGPGLAGPGLVSFAQRQDVLRVVQEKLSLSKTDGGESVDLASADKRRQAMPRSRYF